MQPVLAWVRRRPATVGLALFLVAWYLLQLAVFHLVGEDPARWWFYLEQPPDALSPGVVFAPISHDLYTLKHVGANVALLLFAGGVAEPYVGRRRILVPVVGLGFVGTYVANVTAPIHEMWMVAGTSGGILSLCAYAGFRLRREAVARTLDGVAVSRRGIETVGMATLLVGSPVLLVHQAAWIEQPHSGHVVGLSLGFLYYGVETFVDRSDRFEGGGTPHGR